MLNNKFKISFAYQFGRNLNEILYKGEEYTGETGLFYLDIADFKKIYKDIYAEEYTNQFANVGNYEFKDGGVYGSIYGGEGGIFWDDEVDNGSSLIYNIYMLDYNTEEKENVGKLKIEYKKHANDLYSITGIYLSK